MSPKNKQFSVVCVQGSGYHNFLIAVVKGGGGGRSSVCWTDAHWRLLRHFL